LSNYNKKFTIEEYSISNSLSRIYDKPVGLLDRQPEGVNKIDDELKKALRDYCLNVLRGGGNMQDVATLPKLLELLLRDSDN